MLTDVPTSSEKKVAQTVSEIVSKRKKKVWRYRLAGRGQVRVEIDSCSGGSFLCRESGRVKSKYGKKSKNSTVHSGVK